MSVFKGSFFNPAPPSSDRLYVFIAAVLLASLFIVSAAAIYGLYQAEARIELALYGEKPV